MNEFTCNSKHIKGENLPAEMIKIKKGIIKLQLNLRHKCTDCFIALFK